MKVCLSCGFRDNPYWRHSRFDYDADYMRFEDFMQEYPELAMVLRCKPNGSAIRSGPYSFYRRGTGGLEVYRVLTQDFLMPRERKTTRLPPKRRLHVLEVCV